MHARRAQRPGGSTNKPDIADAPRSAGVYLMKDAGGRVIYVGKARSLRTRVRSYLGAGDDRRSIPFLQDKMRSIEYIPTATEQEALILEDKLIKEYQPRYNSDLKDDRRYFSVKVTVDEEYPRILLVHQRQDDGAQYFGPFPSGAYAKLAVRSLQKKYHLRRCPGPRCRAHGPCMYAQIDACSAPCSGVVSKEDYLERVKQAITALKRMELMTV
jgi:excinuclease ABC subunit C